MRISFMDNDREWRTRDGRLLPLEEIDRAHRRNLIAFLERRAAQIQDDYVHRMLNLDMPIEVFDEIIMTEPVRFVRGLPLMRRLLELEEADRLADEAAHAARVRVERAERRRVRVREREALIEQLRGLVDDAAWHADRHTLRRIVEHVADSA